MNNSESYLYEPIDLCACYEPLFEAPQELLDEWETAHDDKMSDEVPTYYATDENGTLYFYHGNTRIKVSEHFNAQGKSVGVLIENVIRYAARQAENIKKLTVRN